jgi:hypothetical protein
MFGLMIRKFNGSPEIEQAMIATANRIRYGKKFEEKKVDNKQIDEIYKEVKEKFATTLEKLEDNNEKVNQLVTKK